MSGCQPHFCREVKTCDPSAKKDGEYILWLVKNGRRVPVSVYCHKMASSSPKEYITLNPKGNFAYNYEFRGKGRKSCEENTPQNNGGKTYFKKVRLLPKVGNRENYSKFEDGFTCKKST